MFVLDPLLQVIPDTVSILDKRRNWSFIERELAKFGIGLETETKRKILIGSGFCILDFISFLVDFYRSGACTNIGMLLQTSAMQQIQSMASIAIVHGAAGSTGISDLQRKSTTLGTLSLSNARVLPPISILV
jgi:hypothetical protein